MALADEKGDTHLLAATRLTRLLDDHYPLRMVFLNSCEGARGSERDAFSSTAATLVRCGIPAVVAMQYEITDAAAIEFSRSFYEAVADGLPVDAAVAEARTAVSMESMLEWGTPVLYMRSPDGRIFDILPAQNRLETLYAQARRSYHSRDWRAVVEAFARIHAEHPAYPDPEGLLVGASGAVGAWTGGGICGSSQADLSARWTEAELPAGRAEAETGQAAEPTGLTVRPD
jgi:CHAT domain-containing protein